ncbi:MAG: 2-oxoacid:acceptor oxidoreductase subunit alpha [Ilumatobacter sp.]|uniref:2-oxoacid:acceptor oxidoreductase subunit alpha n=1 Tax=Ilumatobacter sp. TaxID=1967498 RepID=UPI00262EAB73|nr:2-oxoacid:acceptor oxidoreductase subunit alpha [Ilumatobacter sp.]MDJ0769210.1 2-oxoacid:acceptor oxidoreductase subunit alpha [Ilumatobacter sp.]
MTDTIERSEDASVLDRLVVRFAGDSGDGMQLTGDRFTSVSASFGNDLSTLPDFPAEIRAPAGTVNGVSSFQVHLADHDITTPGDEPNVLVAMNPAALKADLPRLEAGGTLIVNEDAFDERNLEKAEYDANPLDDGTVAGYRVIKVPMSSMTKEACEPLGVKPRDAERSKNFFALGLVSFMYTRPTEPTIEWIHKKFASREKVAAANSAAFKAGFHFGETTEQVGYRYEVKPAKLPAGEYTSITGNTALAWGLVAAGQLSQLPVTLGSYPITPASDILHELSKHKHFGIRTVQAEDEIAAVGMALGAAFAGHLGVTTTSGPGVALKSETISLAVSIELPLLVIDIQRGGPSTGLPTKTEAADLNMALYGRHGEAPLPVVASYSPAQCFHAAIEAARIALKYRTPVILLSDGYLANGSEPWQIPKVADLPDISVPFATDFNDTDDEGNPVFLPYLRDPDTLARPWAIPGTPGLMHRVGGLEKEDRTGNVNYTPENHQLMGDLRQAKLDRIADDYPDLTITGDEDADLCILGWGSTWAAIHSAVERQRRKGRKLAWIHLEHLNPLPNDLGEKLRRYDTVLVPELNKGQLCQLVRGKYLVDARSVSKVAGLPFRTQEIEDAIEEAAA